jgi:hypothetical protein
MTRSAHRQPVPNQPGRGAAPGKLSRAFLRCHGPGVIEGESLPGPSPEPCDAIHRSGLHLTIRCAVAAYPVPRRSGGRSILGCEVSGLSSDLLPDAAGPDDRSCFWQYSLSAINWFSVSWRPSLVETRAYNATSSIWGFLPESASPCATFGLIPRRPAYSNGSIPISDGR